MTHVVTNQLLVHHVQGLIQIVAVHNTIFNAVWLGGIICTETFKAVNRELSVILNFEGSTNQFLGDVYYWLNNLRAETI